MKDLIFAAMIAFLPNFVKIALYRLTGAEIGKNVRIGLGTIILAKNIKINNNTRIGRFCQFKINALHLSKNVSIGHFVKISVNKMEMGNRTTISSNVNIKGDISDKRSLMRLGMYSWIFEYCYINVTREVILGKNVGIGGGTYLFTHGFWLSKLEGYPVNFGSISIGDNVWIPWGCFLMPGIKIGKNVVVGARSLINRDVPDNALVAGIPAKVIREKSYRKPDTTSITEIITESIAEFAEKINKKFEVEQSKLITKYILDEELFMVLHKPRLLMEEAISKQAINFFMGEIPINWFEKYPCFTLYNSISSREEIIPKIALDWFKFARNIGFRFYPIDEVNDKII